MKVGKFKVSNSNTGLITIQEQGSKRPVVLRRDGKRLCAGDLVAGEVVTYNRLTGEVQSKRKKKPPATSREGRE
jgi:hypothetical protein